MRNTTISPCEIITGYITMGAFREAIYANSAYFYTVACHSGKLLRTAIIAN